MRVEANPRETTGQPVQEGENEFSAEIAQALPTDATVQEQPEPQYDRLCQTGNVAQHVAGGAVQLVGALTAVAGGALAIVSMGALGEGRTQDGMGGGLMSGPIAGAGVTVQQYGSQINEDAANRSCAIR